MSHNLSIITVSFDPEKHFLSYMYMYMYPVAVSQVKYPRYMYMWVTISAHMGDTKLIAATLEIYVPCQGILSRYIHVI